MMMSILGWIHMSQVNAGPNMVYLTYGILLTSIFGCTRAKNSPRPRNGGNPQSLHLGLQAGDQGQIPHLGEIYVQWSKIAI